MRPADSAVPAPALWLGAAMLVAFVFFPLVGTGLTTNDDLRIATGSFCDDLWRCAKAQGRFMYPLTAQFARVPYLVDHAAYFELVRAGSILLNFTLLALFVSRATRSRSLGFLTFCFVLGFVQNSLAHNPLTSYPFLYPASASLMLVSLLAYLAYLDGARWPWLAASGALLFVALSNESLAPFTALFAVLALDPGRVRQRRERFAALAVVAGVALVYVAVYALFRHEFGVGRYAGTTVSLDPSATFRTLWQYSVSALPGYYFHSSGGAANYAPFVLSPGAARYDVATLFAQMRVEWFAKAVVLAAIAVYGCMRLPDVGFRRIALCLAVAVPAMFAPNLVIALTPKYQAWVAHGDLSYTTTYLSHFAVATASAAIVCLVAARLPGRAVTRGGVLLLLAAGIGYLSLATDFHNHYVAQHARAGHAKWRRINAMFATEEFRALEDGTIVFAPSLLVGGVGMNAPELKAYARFKLRRTIRFVSTWARLEVLVRHFAPTAVYYLAYRQDALGEQSHIVLARADNWQSAALGVADEATVLAFSREASIVLVGQVERGAARDVAINGRPVAQHRGTAFSDQLDDTRAPRDPLGYRRIVLRHDGGIRLEGLAVSYGSQTPALTATASGRLSFAQGPHPSFIRAVEGIANPEYWGAWSDGDRVRIRFTRPLPNRFRLTLRGGAWGRNVGTPIRISAGGKHQSVVFSGDPFSAPTEVGAAFDLEGTWADEIHIQVPFPVRSDEDPRAIGLGLVSLGIEDSDNPPMRDEE